MPSTSNPTNTVKKIFFLLLFSDFEFLFEINKPEIFLVSIVCCSFEHFLFYNKKKVLNNSGCWGSFTIHFTFRIQKKKFFLLLFFFLLFKISISSEYIIHHLCVSVCVFYFFIFILMPH